LFIEEKKINNVRFALTHLLAHAVNASISVSFQSSSALPTGLVVALSFDGFDPSYDRSGTHSHLQEVNKLHGFAFTDGLHGEKDGYLTEVGQLNNMRTMPQEITPLDIAFMTVSVWIRMQRAAAGITIISGNCISASCFVDRPTKVPTYKAQCRCVSPDLALGISICNTGCGDPVAVCDNTFGCSVSQKACGGTCTCKPESTVTDLTAMTFQNCHLQCSRIGMVVPSTPEGVAASLDTGCGTNSLEMWVAPLSKSPSHIECRKHNNCPSSTILSKQGVFSVSLSLTELKSSVDLSNGKTHILTTDLNACKTNRFLNVGKWQHVTMSWGKDGYLRHYIDGYQIDKQKFQENAIVPLSFTEYPLIIGNVHVELDEVMIYNVALSFKDIASLVSHAKIGSEVSTLQTSDMSHILKTGVATGVISDVPTLQNAIMDYSAVEPMMTLTFTKPVACMAVRVQNLKFDRHDINDPSLSLFPDQFTARIMTCSGTVVVVHFSEAFATSLKANEGLYNVQVDPHFPAASDIPTGLSASWAFDSIDPTEDTSGNNFHLHGLEWSTQSGLFPYHNITGGKHGGSYMFDQTSIDKNKKNVPTALHHCGSQMTSDYITVAAWVWRNTGSENLESQTILSKEGQFRMALDKDGYLVSEFILKSNSEDLNPITGLRGAWTSNPTCRFKSIP